MMPRPPAAVEAEDGPPAFAAVVAGWNAARNQYLRARVLADGAGVSPRAIVERLVDETVGAFDETVGAFDETSLDALLRWLALGGAELEPELEIVALNAGALLALRRARWEVATELATEANARDHHDLLAQRLADAAAARSATLEAEVDAWLADRFCPAPFQQIETRTNGAVHFCCSAWQPAPIGNINDGSDAFWNSEPAREIRRSVHDGDFSHCSRWHCPAIAARRLPRRDAVAASGSPMAAIVASRALEVRAPPARVILSHDRSCNIACPSCRDHRILLDHARTRALNALFDSTLLGLVSGARAIKVTGSGDPFGSRHFRYVLKRLTADPPRRRLQLHTNGLLCDARAWRELGLAGHVDSVWISIDAACAGTYAELRGGDFSVLMQNLAFLGGLRKAGEFNRFRLDFVVQRRNFREMGAFVDLARDRGADAVYFLRLRNWGHLRPDDFRAMDVCDPGHPEHPELLQVLADSRLRSPSVEQGSLSGLIRKATGEPD
jgi:hypothetical protein